ncbi:KxYKxGKxW signal peptide domain-containing protein [Eupransor demetentiae]|uniref:Heme-binding NEAT domain (NEAT) n=1 Tax=Eupransor demetentiae TaxID=3109584 RepID=A0ABM9N4K3_9LACO|nr:Heme-binding NEAT domain (NEAT) [Lactobacillaceae bacterium LMG 33000]
MERNMHVKMFKAGKMWMTASVVALGIGAAGIAANQNMASADDVVTAPAASGLADGTYQIDYSVTSSDSTQDEQLNDMFTHPATAVVSGDNATVSLSLTGENAAQIAGFITNMSIDGHAATKSGTNFTVTLPKSDLKKGTLDLDVTLSAMGQTQSAKAGFNINDVDQNGKSVLPATPTPNPTPAPTPQPTPTPAPKPDPTPAPKPTPSNGGNTPSNNGGKVTPTNNGGNVTPANGGNVVPTNNGGTTPAADVTPAAKGGSAALPKTGAKAMSRVSDNAVATFGILALLGLSTAYKYRRQH